eukprot:SAG31_NODE_879_length_11292_cov_49.116680_2_plen_238_part_00
MQTLPCSSESRSKGTPARRCSPVVAPCQSDQALITVAGSEFWPINRAITVHILSCDVVYVTWQREHVTKFRTVVAKAMREQRMNTAFDQCCQGHVRKRWFALCERAACMGACQFQLAAFLCAVRWTHLHRAGTAPPLSARAFLLDACFVPVACCCCCCLVQIPCRVTLSRLVPYFFRLKSRISRIVAQKREKVTALTEGPRKSGRPEDVEIPAPVQHLHHAGVSCCFRAGRPSHPLL